MQANTVITTTSPDSVAVLLELNGAKLRGRNRADCPDCGGCRTVAYDELKDVFYCHHSGCTFRGGKGTLRRRLGLHREWLPREEFLQRRRDRTRASTIAGKLYAAWNRQWSGRIDRLRALRNLEDRAHKLGPDNPRTWGTLGIIYETRPRTLSELLFLESSPLPNLIEFLGLDAKGRKAVIERVIFNGGIHDSEGRFIELIM